MPKYKTKISEVKRKEIKKLYLNELKNYKEISLIFGCSPTLIRRVLKELKVNTSISHRRKLLFREGKLTSFLKGKTKNNYEPIKRASEINSKIKKQMFKEGKLPRFIGLRGKSIFPNAGKKISKKRKGQHNSLKTEFKKGHKLFEDSNYKEKTIKAMLKGLMKRPTSFEQKIILLCSKHRLPFIYTGDGRFLVGYKNPDFKHKYLPILIEVYNDFHHPENYEEIRGNHFKKYGYETIFINEGEVTNKNWENICLNKIKEFVK